MIGRLRGILVSAFEGGVCIEVGGVGYEVNMTPRGLVSLPGIGEEVVVHTHTHVREEEISLFGFDNENERDLYRVLLGASGVGTKVAMAMLGTMSPQDIIRSIAAEDSDALTVVPGIGKRGAQRIVLELAPKLAGKDADVLQGSGSASVRAALETLGYSTEEINSVIGKIDPSESVETQVREALRTLGSR
jgi:Holliday junction DNA helicase RuvA